MPHTLLAFGSISFGFVCIIFSFFRYRKSDYNTSALLLVLAAFVLRVFTASDMYLHEWDERYHALVAKHLMDNWLMPTLYTRPLLPYSYQNWSLCYIWLHKQPLPLWSMALSMKLLGVNEMALRVPSVIVSSISVYLTYLIAAKLFSEKVGLVAAFFHAVNGMMIEITGGRIATDHVDVWFMFLVESGVLMSVLSAQNKKWLPVILTGVFIGLAVLCKWLPAFIVLPIWLLLNYGKRSLPEILAGMAAILITAMVVFIPWQWYMYTKFPVEYANEMAHNYKHITQVLDGNGGGIFYFFDKLFITLNEFIWVALTYFGYITYNEKYNRANKLMLLVWFILPFIFFSIAKTKMQAYLLFVYPALFIVLAVFGLWLSGKTDNVYFTKAKQVALAVMIILTIRYSVERLKPLQDQSKQLYWADKLRALNAGSDNKVYVNVKHCIEGMFYTDAVMYSYVPSQLQIDSMVKQGYEVVVNNDPDL
jgi:4-amino-4-deoxy-L-arabinose transferase